LSAPSSHDASRVSIGTARGVTDVSSEKIGIRHGASTRRPLRICHLAYSFYDADNRVIRYAETLAERGDEVDVISLRRADMKWHDLNGSVRIFRIQRRAVTERHAWMYLVKILWFFIRSSVLLSLLQLRKRYDVVHVHNVPDFLVFAAALPKLMGARVILDIHDILPELYAGKFGVGRHSPVFRFLLHIERLSCQFADHVIVSNHLWHATLIQRSVHANKCSTMLNYPDLRVFRPGALDTKGGADKFIILYPGSLNHHQGVDIAVKAFALIKDRMPVAELHIYGEGPGYSDLLRLIAECGLKEHVRLLKPLSLAKIAEVMAAADVGVVPKRAEGFGNEAFSTKTLEFMACGVPVVVSRTKIDAYYFSDTVVSFFTPGDETHLAEVLLEHYTQRSNHAGRIEAARELAMLYSWQERAGDYRNLIESLVASTRGEKARA
jgi:glycosyltransferase involved in cell wall biosynthesis